MTMFVKEAAVKAELCQFKTCRAVLGRNVPGQNAPCHAGQKRDCSHELALFDNDFVVIGYYLEPISTNWALTVSICR